MSEKIKKPAVKIIQGDMHLILTAFTLRDFARKGFYRVNRLDVEQERGMQRILDTARAKRFASDFAEANKADEALLPTSVFLATEGEIKFDEGSGDIVFDVSPQAGICPFDVVDGQHRIEGLRAAASQTDGELWDFPVATVIAPGLNEAGRMLQFIVVNTKQEKVDDGVAQHISARFTDMDGVQDLPYIPGWLRKKIDRGDDKHALHFVVALNRDNDSPFCGRIQMADEHKSKLHTINQKSFVKLITKHVLTANHPLFINERDPDKQVQMFKNFWQAIVRVFVGEYAERTSVFTQNSVEFFLQILGPILNQLAKQRSYTVDKFEVLLRSADETDDYPGMLTPEFWKRGGQASILNAGGMRKMATSYVRALASANAGDSVTSNEGD